MRRVIPLLAALIACAATPAFAHVGVHPESGFGAGFGHPFGGLDHLLAMTAVGLWAGLARPSRPWLWPATFVAAMLAGFAGGSAGVQVGGAEALIVASVVALGLAATARLKVPAAAGCAVVAAAGLAHGYAHGVEAPAGAGVAGFVAGFVLASIILHLAGLALAWTAQRPGAPRIAQLAGLGVATAGLALAWGG
jgi:urease accessory protein